MIQLTDTLRIVGFDDYNLVLEHYRQVKNKETKETSEKWCFAGYFPTLVWFIPFFQNSARYDGLCTSSEARDIVKMLKQTQLSEKTRELKTAVIKREGLAENMKQRWASGDLSGRKKKA